MSRILGRLMAPLSAVLLLAAPAPWLATVSADDAIMAVERYNTPKARALATTHQSLLKQIREEIYYCLPWVSVQKSGIGFRQPKGNAADDRYLSVWIVIDQDEDARFAALPAGHRASAMFSRYGTDLLRRMTALRPIVSDAGVQGFSVVLSWLKPGSGGASGTQPVNETLALFIDKPSALGFLAKRILPAEFVRRSKFSLFDGTQELGRMPLEVWDDSFVRTFKVANYEMPKGQKCSS